VEVLTDNRNRAVSEIRHASRRMAATWRVGSVRFMFAKKGVIAMKRMLPPKNQLMDIVLEHGGEDLSDEGDSWELIKIRLV